MLEKRGPKVGRRTFELLDFDGIFRGLDDLFAPPRSSQREAVKETDDGFLVRVELAGFTKDDVNVSVEDGVLSVKATVSEKDEWAELRKAFSVSYKLPNSADSENISGDLKDGVLLLTIPKIEAKKPKKLQIALS